ncbi:hypothetical protein LP414_18275 [Polaromonas sp. P1(28)-13]|nr:hypothetical protein LP414_18275 [Polaromonas sp. P1(28)-13]
MGIRVECYAGYRGEQEPRAFHLGERRIEVKAILDRWLAPDHRYFKVQGDDGNTYILRHDEVSGDWEMTMYSAGPVTASASRAAKNQVSQTGIGACRMHQRPPYLHSGG